MNYKIYPFKREGKIRFYVRFDDQHGKQRNLSTGVAIPFKHTNKQRVEAEKKAEKAAKKKVLRYLGMDQQVKTKRIDRLSDYLKDYYYPHMKANRAARTLTTYKRALNHLLDLSGDHPLPYYNRSHFHDYKIHRFNNDGVRKTTINIELRAIKAAFSWAYKNDYVDHFAFKGQEYLFETRVIKREFKDHELQRLFEATEGQMIGLAIQLAYHTGMRQGELSRAKWRMVNKKNGVVFIHLPESITKSKKPRLVPLNSKAIDILKQLKAVLSTKRENHPVWYREKPFAECYILQKDRGWGRYRARSLQDMFRKNMNQAGLPKELTFHSLRHSFATHALEQGADLYGVSKIMGHSSPQVTADFYDHTTALNYHSVVELLVGDRNEDSQFSFLDE